MLYAASFNSSSTSYSPLSGSSVVRQIRAGPYERLWSRKTSRRLPGSCIMKIGQDSFSFGNARSATYGVGGSGEPTTREVVSAIRFSMPYGRTALSCGGPTNCSVA